MFLSVSQGEEEGGWCPLLPSAFCLHGLNGGRKYYISVRCVSIFQTAGCACFVTGFAEFLKLWLMSNFILKCKRKTSRPWGCDGLALGTWVTSFLPRFVLVGSSRSHQALLSLAFALWYPVVVVKLDEMSKSMGFFPWKDTFGTAAAYLPTPCDIDILVMLSFAIRYL